MRKILTVVGARPQFVKASVVSRAIQKISGMREILLHTGQHFDANMSRVFFEQLGLPRPDVQLDIHGGLHGEMTARMLSEIERVILRERPDRVLVYGDTNSTLAAALAAAKLSVPVAHIEAGLRSFNNAMPEEINRIVTDQLSDLLFCPTEAAILNLHAEGFANKPAKILHPGDVMQDAAVLFAAYAVAPESLPSSLGDNARDSRLAHQKEETRSGSFILSTLHRAENTDDTSRLTSIVTALNRVHQKVAPVVLPLHPRTRDAIEREQLKLDVHIIPPVGYFEMLWLLQNCGLVLTDSGGVQKEAFFFGKPCATLRDQTEWVELVELGANELVGASPDGIESAANRLFGTAIDDRSQLFGGGLAAESIAMTLDELM